jgi:hypothetical protein
MRTALSRAFTGSIVIGSRWVNKPAFRGLRVLAQGAAYAATALLPVIAFVAVLDPNGPLRGTRSPDPLPLPDATAGGLAAVTVSADNPNAAAADVEEISFIRMNFRAPNEDRTAGAGVNFLAHAPEAIRALDGRTVRLTGFMIPVDMQGWNVRRCVIVPSQANCCYGQAPRFCEFVVATMTGDVPLALDIPLAFTGTLRVGDVAEGDVWSAFYTMECVAVER